MSEDTPNYGNRPEKVAQLRHDLANVQQGGQGVQLQRLFERVAALDKRIEELEKPIHVELPPEVHMRLGQLESAVTVLMGQISCEHKAFSVDGHNPFYLIAIADEHELSILVPGQKPNPVFAIGICEKCWKTFVAVDRTAEVKAAQKQGPKLVK